MLFPVEVHIFYLTLIYLKLFHPTLLYIPLSTCVQSTLVYPTPGLSNTWFIQHLHMVYPTPGLSNTCTWFIQHLVYPTPGLSNTWFIQHLVYLIRGLSNTWFIQRLVCLCILSTRNRHGQINEGLLYNDVNPLCSYAL